mmetsp:Transcript_22506/g.52348  ORF Transcript_22506/g.52348 Transcript_22506/m.52348 type:complete len:1607 (+) Transcript_22506:42-4862(+)
MADDSDTSAQCREYVFRSLPLKIPLADAQPTSPAALTFSISMHLANELAAGSPSVVLELQEHEAPSSLAPSPMPTLHGLSFRGQQSLPNGSLPRAKHEAPPQSGEDVPESSNQLVLSQTCPAWRFSENPRHTRGMSRQLSTGGCRSMPSRKSKTWSEADWQRGRRRLGPSRLAERPLLEAASGGCGHTTQLSPARRKGNGSILENATPEVAFQQTSGRTASRRRADGQTGGAEPEPRKEGHFDDDASECRSSSQKNEQHQQESGRHLSSATAAQAARADGSTQIGAEEAQQLNEVQVQEGSRLAPLPAEEAANLKGSRASKSAVEDASSQPQGADTNLEEASLLRQESLGVVELEGASLSRGCSKLSCADHLAEGIVRIAMDRAASECTAEDREVVMLGSRQSQRGEELSPAQAETHLLAGESSASTTEAAAQMRAEEMVLAAVEPMDPPAQDQTQSMDEHTDARQSLNGPPESQAGAEVDEARALVHPTAGPEVLEPLQNSLVANGEEKGGPSSNVHPPTVRDPPSAETKRQNEHELAGEDVKEADELIGKSPSAASTASDASVSEHPHLAASLLESVEVLAATFENPADKHAGEKEGPPAGAEADPARDEQLHSSGVKVRSESATEEPTPQQHDELSAAAGSIASVAVHAAQTQEAAAQNVDADAPSAELRSSRIEGEAELGPSQTPLSTMEPEQNQASSDANVVPRLPMHLAQLGQDEMEEGDGDLYLEADGIHSDHQSSSSLEDLQEAEEDAIGGLNSTLASGYGDHEAAVKNVTLSSFPSASPPGHTWQQDGSERSSLAFSMSQTAGSFQRSFRLGSHGLSVSMHNGEDDTELHHCEASALINFDVSCEEKDIASQAEQAAAALDGNAGNASAGSHDASVGNSQGKAAGNFEEAASNAKTATDSATDSRSGSKVSVGHSAQLQQTGANSRSASMQPGSSAPPTTAAGDEAVARALGKTSPSTQLQESVDEADEEERLKCKMLSTLSRLASSAAAATPEVLAADGASAESRSSTNQASIHFASASVCSPEKSPHTAGNRQDAESAPSDSLLPQVWAAGAADSRAGSKKSAAACSSATPSVTMSRKQTVASSTGETGIQESEGSGVMHVAPAATSSTMLDSTATGGPPSAAAADSQVKGTASSSSSGGSDTQPRGASAQPLEGVKVAPEREASKTIPSISGSISGESDSEEELALLGLEENEVDKALNKALSKKMLNEVATLDPTSAPVSRRQSTVRRSSLDQESMRARAARIRVRMKKLAARFRQDAQHGVSLQDRENVEDMIAEALQDYDPLKGFAPRPEEEVNTAAQEWLEAQLARLNGASEFRPWQVQGITAHEFVERKRCIADRRYVRSVLQRWRRLVHHEAEPAPQDGNSLEALLRNRLQAETMQHIGQDNSNDPNAPPGTHNFMSSPSMLLGDESSSKKRHKDRGSVDMLANYDPLQPVEAQGPRRRALVTQEAQLPAASGPKSAEHLLRHISAAYSAGGEEAVEQLEWLFSANTPGHASLPSAPPRQQQRRPESQQRPESQPELQPQTPTQPQWQPQQQQRQLLLGCLPCPLLHQAESLLVWTACCVHWRKRWHACMRHRHCPVFDRSLGHTAQA